jgi:hypothetical protein
MAARAPPNRLL